MIVDDDFGASDTAFLLVRVRGASGVDMNTYTLTVLGNVSCAPQECGVYDV
jgi:hypothetical protein